MEERIDATELETADEVQTPQEPVDEPSTAEIPLVVRVINNFNTVEETTFWPSEVTNTVESIMSPQTFKEFNEVLTYGTQRSLDNIEQTVTKHLKEYKTYVNELERTKNVFSFDVDYI